MPTEFYSVEALCSILGLHPDTVREYLRKGIIAGVQPYGRRKGWMVSTEQLAQFMQKNGLKTDGVPSPVEYAQSKG